MTITAFKAPYGVELDNHRLESVTTSNPTALQITPFGQGLGTKSSYSNPYFGLGTLETSTPMENHVLV